MRSRLLWACCGYIVATAGCAYHLPDEYRETLGAVVAGTSSDLATGDAAVCWAGAASDAKAICALLRHDAESSGSSPYLVGALEGLGLLDAQQAEAWTAGPPVPASCEEFP